MKDCNHFVLPVFYHVDPSDVQKQEGSFKLDVNDSPRWTVDNVNRWKTALTKAANLTGLVLQGYVFVLLLLYNHYCISFKCMPLCKWTKPHRDNDNCTLIIEYK